MLIPIYIQTYTFNQPQDDYSFRPYGKRDEDIESKSNLGSFKVKNSSCTVFAPGNSTPEPVDGKIACQIEGHPINLPASTIHYLAKNELYGFRMTDQIPGESA